MVRFKCKQPAFYFQATLPSGLNFLHGQRHIVSRRRSSDQGVPKGVGAVLRNNIQRVQHVALGLGHLLSLGVAHQAVQVDRVEGHLVSELQRHHHHARNPEEQDVVAGLQHAGRVEALQVLRILLRPAHCCERPKSRAG